MAFIVETALGTAISELLKVVITVAKQTSSFKPNLESLVNTLKSVESIFNEMKKLHKFLDHPKQETDQFIDQLNRGAQLVYECRTIPSWKKCKQYTYSKKLKDLDNSIVKFFQVEVQGLAAMNSLRTEVGVKESNHKLNLLLKHFNISDSGSSSRGSVPGIPDGVVGYDQQLKDKEMVKVISAPGECGKTNLAKMPCHDPDIQNVNGHAASNLVAGGNLESTILQILDMGGGSWERDTVVRAMRAANNNLERAVEYLYSGIPEQAVAPVSAQAPGGGQAVNPPPQPQAPQTTVPHGGPNANPLNLFPQRLPNTGSNASAGNLEFLRNNPQFQALRTMVQNDPRILLPMLQELGKQNPDLMRLIQAHQAEFLGLINEPVEGGQGNMPGQLGGAAPKALALTLEEWATIERGLPNMGSNASAGNLEVLRNIPQFQALRTMVQTNPQIFQPMLQELGKVNPDLMRLIQDNQAEFLGLINEPVEGGQGNMLGQLGGVAVTPEERNAIQRLEAMGFSRAVVLEVFIACSRDEELAAIYLLDHDHDFEMM